MKTRVSLPQDEEIILVAGITAGIYFRLHELDNGVTPAPLVPGLLSRFEDLASSECNIEMDGKAHMAMHTVAVSVGFDDTGLGEKLARRYKTGNTSLTESEAQQVLEMSQKRAEDFARLAQAAAVSAKPKRRWFGF